MWSRADVIGLLSNNVVSFSRNVVLRDHLFSLNSVSKPRMLSVRADYVLSSLQLRCSIRLCIKFLLTFSAVAIGDLLPGLIDIVERFFWLCLARQNGGDAHIEFVPVICGSWNSQVDFLSRQDQVGIISVEIRDRVGFIPTLVHPLFDVPGSHRREILILHGWLHPSPTSDDIEKSVLFISHEREEIVGRFFLFGLPRNHTMPTPAVRIPDRIERGLFPLVGQRVECLRCPRNNRRTHSTLHAGAGAVLGQRG